MRIEISERNLALIQDALATQIRLLASYINPDEEILKRLRNFQELKDDIDELMLRI